MCCTVSSPSSDLCPALSAGTRTESGIEGLRQCATETGKSAEKKMQTLHIYMQRLPPNKPVIHMRSVGGCCKMKNFAAPAVFAEETRCRPFLNSLSAFCQTVRGIFRE